MAATDAAANIKAALATKTRGYRSPDGGKQLVEIVTGDVIEVCKAISDPDPVVEQLRKGSEGVGNPTKKANIYADDAFHLLEQFDG